jgi:hypothetical protein
MKETIIIAVAACVCGLIIMLIRRADTAKKLALGGIGGLAALGTVNLTGMLTGITLAPNLWTLGAAVLLGLPGVVGMLFVKLVLMV